MKSLTLLSIIIGCGYTQAFTTSNLPNYHHELSSSSILSSLEAAVDANSSSDDDLLTGRVIFFDIKKGFGFIEPDGDGYSSISREDNVFAHQSNIRMDGFRLLLRDQVGI